MTQTQFVIALMLAVIMTGFAVCMWVAVAYTVRRFNEALRTAKEVNMALKSVGMSAIRLEGIGNTLLKEFAFMSEFTTAMANSGQKYTNTYEPSESATKGPPQKQTEYVEYPVPPMEQYDIVNPEDMPTDDEVVKAATQTDEDMLAAQRLEGLRLRGMDEEAELPEDDDGMAQS